MSIEARKIGRVLAAHRNRERLILAVQGFQANPGASEESHVDPSLLPEGYTLWVPAWTTAGGQWQHRRFDRDTRQTKIECHLRR
jgi:hypothetical protein